MTALDRTRAVTLDMGTLTSLDNQVDPTTGTVKAKARFANTAGTLFPNQFVNVQLLLNTLEGAVTVPVTALRFGGSGNFVYVLNAGTRTVAQRPVKAGQASVDKVVITEGLAVGESVITEGADRLKDGASVVLPGDAPRGARRPASGASGSAGSGSGAAASGSQGYGRRQGADGAASAASAPASTPRTAASGS